MMKGKKTVVVARDTDGKVWAEEPVRESKIESYFVKEVEIAGGEAEKFVSPEKSGVPDRKVLWDGGNLDYVELKATNETPDAHQIRDHKRRRDRGFRVFVLNSFKAVDWYIEKGRFLSWAEYMERVDGSHPWCV
jgi:hypothetical protein